MKRIVLLLFLLAVLAGCGPPRPPLEASSTVYVTRTGKRYHRDWCSSLRRSKRAVRLDYAERVGWTACLNCK